MKLLTKANPKLIKGEKEGYLTTGIHLYPDKQICQFASLECLDLCLNTAGRGKQKKIQSFRKVKTGYFKNDTDKFMLQLVKEITSFKKRAGRLKLIPAIRLNLTSDIDYSEIACLDNVTSIFYHFSELQFYDYTKDFHKALSNKIPNYHLTFSFNGHNWRQCETVLLSGKNVAFVFKGELPKTYRGKLRQSYPVIDGDKNDLRFLDRKPVIVGLLAKGKAKNLDIHSNFIIEA